jgi:hypothetical protein
MRQMTYETVAADRGSSTRSFPSLMLAPRRWDDLDAVDRRHRS